MGSYLFFMSMYMCIHFVPNTLCVSEATSPPQRTTSVSLGDAPLLALLFRSAACLAHHVVASAAYRPTAEFAICFHCIGRCSARHDDCVPFERSP